MSTCTPLQRGILHKMAQRVLARAWGKWLEDYRMACKVRRCRLTLG